MKPIFKSLHFEAHKTQFLCKWTAKMHKKLSIFSWKQCHINGTPTKGFWIYMVTLDLHDLHWIYSFWIYMIYIGFHIHKFHINQLSNTLLRLPVSRIPPSLNHERPLPSSSAVCSICAVIAFHLFCIRDHYQAFICSIHHVGFAKYCLSTCACPSVSPSTQSTCYLWPTLNLHCLSVCSLPYDLQPVPDSDSLPPAST